MTSDDEINYKPDANTLHPPATPYTAINDVPLPVRAHVITLARKGMPPVEIAARFELPLTWVILLVECPPGSTVQ